MLNITEKNCKDYFPVLGTWYLNVRLTAVVSYHQLLRTQDPETWNKFIISSGCKLLFHIA